MPNINITPIDEDAGGLWHLFEARKPIYQAKVKGVFRNIKYVLMVVLLGLYYALPWVRWDRGVGAPDQAILIDTIGRKFYFFFIELWPQEVIYFTGLLLLAALGLFLATTLLGRVWCGYACPQTVWTDLFMHVERWFEGDRNAQIKLAKQPLSFNKAWRKLGKHIVWLLIGLGTGGAWVFYFQDAPTLMNDMLHGKFYFIPTFWMVFLTFSTYLMAGFAREQVCTYMCPYARFQGAMFDEDSLLVTYDKARGEPRGKAEDAGDCVDCGRCVAVCPTGIDIRDGQQYRCINCGLCIDACNTVMEKLGRKGNLIRYNTLNSAIPSKATWIEAWTYARFIRPRTVIYSLVMLVVGSTMLWSLLHKSPFEMNVLHGRNPTYVMLRDGSVRNSYTLRLLNKTWHPQIYTLALPHGQGLMHTVQSPTPATTLALQVAGGEAKEFTIFIERQALPDMPQKSKAVFTATDANGKTKTYTSIFLAP